MTCSVFALCRVSAGGHTLCTGLGSRRRHILLEPCDSVSVPITNLDNISLLEDAAAAVIARLRSPMMGALTEDPTTESNFNNFS